MIRNERQYKVTQRQRKGLADALTALSSGGVPVEAVGNEPAASLVLDLQRASLEGQIADLDIQLHEYEQLRSGQVNRAFVTSFSALPQTLIKARIAAGLTQRELADRLGMKEQQIQRYESEGYASASLSRLEEVRQVLGVEMEAGVDLPAAGSLLSRLRKALRDLGFDRAVIENRLLRDAGNEAGPGKVAAITERVARTIGISAESLLSGDAGQIAFSTTARFKAPKNASEVKLQAYARYADGIARIVLRATTRLDHQAEIPPAEQFRDALNEIVRSARSADGRPTDGAPSSAELFSASLRLLLNLGVPVIPLRDPGAFHGACFTIDGRPAIVLKQTGDSVARWLNDLLHETGHLHDHLSRRETKTWIERGDISQWSDDPEEQHANDFAADVLFEGRAGFVVAQCKRAGSVERMKAIISPVSRQAEVAPDILAGYLAFQLQREGINWWGTAASFQEPGMPWRTAVDELLAELDFSELDQVERAILMDALSS